MAAVDLITTDEALAFLGKQEISDVPALTTHITAASMWIENMTERTLAVRTFTDMRVLSQTSPVLRLPVWPIDVATAMTVKVGGTTQTIWKQESDGDPADFDVIVGSDDPFDARWGLRNHLFRRGGWVSTFAWNYPGPWQGGIGLTAPFSQPIGVDYQTLAQPYGVLVSYRGGYGTTANPVPDDLKLACNYLVQKLWQDQSGQHVGVTQISTPTGGSITLPDPAMPTEVRMLLLPYARNQSLIGLPARPAVGGVV